MFNLNEVKSILKTILRWDEWLGDDGYRRLSNDCMTDIANDARKTLKDLDNIYENDRHWLLSWEYANGVDEELNIIWRPLVQRFYDSHCNGNGKPEAITEALKLKTKKNIRNISLKLCANVTMILEEIEDLNG